ncbi:alkaline phosphatase family protein [Bradyrhizobium sp. AS23.2]|uniref:alkaline phosphatase family protein n=1 Tax=Bradyrhizobium sp. AS23.2 TaxID=1680155 RepID=UPI00093E986A|nr:alkaline phosphatase family protein [Bradyrhizobium sp. AS23.2]
MLSFIARAPPARKAQAIAVVVLLCVLFSAGRVAAQSAGLERIQHVIVIYQENWSFDGLYGKFPGADGLANAGERIRQIKKDGTPYLTLPQPLDTSKKPPIPDSRFPTDLPVAPYDIAQYVPPHQKVGDIVNRAQQEKRQINGGRMDGFVAWSENGGLAMSYYDATDLPIGRLAQQYTLADRFFHSAFDGSMINHLWLICACTPSWSNAPANLRIQMDAQGIVVKDGSVTPDGYVVHTVYPANRPYPGNIEDPGQLIPLLDLPTIGDRLSEKGISWAWYSGGWKDAVAGHPDALFQFHHQPFNYFAPYAEGKAARTEHLKDTEDFLAALRAGNLPAVVFIKPIGADNEHPGYSDLLRGEQHVASLVNAVQESVFWKDSVIIVTYDEGGGRWDHVPPPPGDRWGPGVRIPAVIISPFAKRGFVDHTTYETVSILKLIETRWNVAPLGSRDAAANNLLNAFDFFQTP